jgi:hypothetical protein
MSELSLRGVVWAADHNIVCRLGDSAHIECQGYGQRWGSHAVQAPGYRLDGDPIPSACGPPRYFAGALWV